MKKPFFFPSDNAVVGVVTAVLIIGLIVAVVSLVQTVYVPKMMEQREAEHMDDVADQFAWLKSSIDNQVAMKNENVPVVSSITLGSKELPYLLSVRAFGSIQVIEDAFTIIFTNSSQPTRYVLGTLQYNSMNAYYLDQSFIYETGGIIVSQSDGDMMYVRPRPSFFIPESDNIYNLSITLVNISVGGEKSSATGYGNFPIQTEFLNSNRTKKPLEDILNITIETKYPNAWSAYLRSSLDNAGYVNKYEINTTKDKVLIKFLTGAMGSIMPVNLEIDFVNISAQVGPGWIE